MKNYFISGKMGKIFKNKKPQTMENGSRITGTVNQKSKVCVFII